MRHLPEKCAQDQRKNENRRRVKGLAIEVGAHFGQEPDASVSPDLVSLSGGNLEHVSSFAQRKTGKVPELDQLSGHGVLRLELAQRLINRQDFIGRAWCGNLDLPQLVRYLAP